jgi:phytoene dehydrogenase-like protein
MNNQNTILIIGGGFAGLAAGIYARMNGYQTRIFEMHNLPGGLCTSWKRKGFTIDGCIHWLVGSSPGSMMNDIWKEVGVARGLRIINMDEYMRFESRDGRKLIFYTDLHKLEKHLLEFSPEDAGPVGDFIKGIKMCLPFDSPGNQVKPMIKWTNRIRLVGTFLLNGRRMKRWMKTTASDFSKRLKDPLLREAFREIWLPGFSMFFMLFTFAYLHRKNAGYPAGGSTPMSEAMASRYQSLGGTIHYNSRVEKIIVDNNNRATGIKLADNSEYYGARIISAADGFYTIFRMLDGKYGNTETFDPYRSWATFPALLYIGIGVDQTFEGEPKSVSGTYFELDEPVSIGGSNVKWLSYHLFNHDHSLAPEGKTVLVAMFYTDYDFWKSLASIRETYLKAKEEAGGIALKMLEQKFPGISVKAEMIDVATPLTFENYTGNWKGSFEGWQITPENAQVLIKRMKQTLPGLKYFYMCGQWVEPGGGLPTSVMSARRLIKTICREDRKKFTTTMD